MAAITITDLNNGKLDVELIEKLATSAEHEATDRLGNVKKTWSGIEHELGAEYAETVTGGNRIASELARSEAQLARDQSYAGPNARPSIAAALADASIAVGASFTAPLADGSFQSYTKTSTSVATAFGGPLASATRIKPVTELFYGASEFTYNGYILDGGGFNPSGAWGATGFCEVLGGEEYKVYTRCPAGAHHCWYDKDKVRISSFGGAEATFQALIVTAPANARYVRVSAAQWPTVDAYVQGTSAALNIRKERQVLQQHPVSVPATSVDNNGTPLNVSLAAVSTVMTAMTRETDLVTDRTAPFFVNGWQFTKSPLTPATQLAAVVASRNSDTQFTVASGFGSNFISGGALVVEDGTTGEISSYFCSTVVGDVINIIGTLPANPINAQCMFDQVNGQHLSRLAYKGLADFIVGRLQRYSYKKNAIFEYHPPVCGTPAPADSNVYTLDGLTKRFDVTKLGGAGYGGFVPGTTNLGRTCQTKTGAEYNVGSGGGSQYLGKAYDITAAAAGDGISIKIPLAGVEGFLEVPVAAVVGTYISSVDGSTQTHDGKVRLQVLADGVSIHDQNYEAGRVHYVTVSFAAGYAQLEVRVTLAETKVSWIRLCALYAYAKSSTTPVSGYFQREDVVAFWGDSWTQFPPPIGGETLPLRPDGSIAEGMQFLSERMRTRLAAQGITVTTLNMGKSGQTSEWGRYWIDKILALTPRPTHCVLCFYINDRNSGTADAGNTDSAYDIDPLNMWANKVISAGGIKGSVSAARWFANMQAICLRLTLAGIKPVVLMPSFTASVSQAQTLRTGFLHKMACGFRDTNTAGGA